MPQLEEVASASAALLVMHYQEDVFTVLFGDAEPPVLARVNALIARWRSTGRPVIFANFALGTDYEAVSSSNRLMTGLAKTGLFREPRPAASLTVDSRDRLYICPRVSVFYGTALTADLRAAGIDTLVMAGITSSGVVLSSLAHASDADYQVFVVEACCFDPDQNAHEALFRTGFATRASIL